MPRPTVILLILLCCWTIIAFGQSTSIPVEPATITLLHATGNSKVASTVTDKKGFFELQAIKEGNYTIVL